MNIFDLLKSEAIAHYVESVENTQVPYIGPALFPVKKTMDLDLKWVLGANGLPVALKPSTFDAKATLRNRIGFKEMETELPFFREAMNMTEKDRRLLKSLENSGEVYYKEEIKRIYNDVKSLVDGADVQAERMIHQLLSTGGISITANNVPYEYEYADEDYEKTNMKTLSGTAKWSATETADPIKDIRAMQKASQKAGRGIPTRAICNSNTYQYLLDNVKIKTAINGAANLADKTLEITEEQLNAYIRAKCNGLTITVYDNMYIDEEGNTQYFFPDDKFTLMPAHALGSTWYSYTPEECAKMDGEDIDCSVVNTGVAITTIFQEHPVKSETVVSEIVMPSFEQMLKVYILSV